MRPSRYEAITSAKGVPDTLDSKRMAQVVAGIEAAIRAAAQ